MTGFHIQNYYFTRLGDLLDLWDKTTFTDTVTLFLFP